MKIKFFLLSFLLLFARGCDFYSTSLWFFQNNGIKNERNPLTFFFGVGWSGLIVTNVLMILIIISLLYYFYFRYQQRINFIPQPKNYKELASFQYFDKADKFYQIFYKVPKDKKVILAYLGYVLTISIIIASFLATFHNLCQFYSLALYKQFRLFIGRPLYVIYTLIFLTAILTYRNLLKSEYEKYKNISSNN